MSSASSAVTYTSVYTDSEPGRVFWGADEEISDGGSPWVIVYGYDGLLMQPVAPPSLDYILGPEEPHTPPVPQDDDEREPMFIQPHDPDYVREPIYPKYIPLEDDHEFLDPEEYEDDETEDGPVDYPMDGGEDRDDDDGDSHEDDADDEDEDKEDEDEEDGEKEEEHLALTDSAVVVPIVELVSLPEGTEPVIPPPSTDITTTGARITVRLQASISLPPKVEVERLLAMPTPPPSPLISLSPPSIGERLAMSSTQDLVDAVTTALPSPLLLPLPPSLYIPPPVDRRDDIPESERPPRKRSCLFSLGPRFEAGESSTARPTRGLIHAYLEDAQDSKTRISQRVTIDSQRADLLMEDKIAHQETILIIEEEAYASREAWAHAIGLSQAVHSELQTQYMRLAPRCSRLRWQSFERLTAELLALREQQRRARQPRPDVKVPDHQDASRDADSHILRRWMRTIVLANDLMDQKSELCERQIKNDNKRKLRFIQKTTMAYQTTLKRQNVAKVYNMGAGEKKPYGGSFAQCAPVSFHLNGPWAIGAVPKGNGCFECGAPGRFKRDCPKLKNKDGEMGMHKAGYTQLEM
ncbi:putative reverse transcriptase domain-containing protein [Tanacetum coccineum]